LVVGNLGVCGGGTKPPGAVEDLAHRELGLALFFLGVAHTLAGLDEALVGSVPSRGRNPFGLSELRIAHSELRFGVPHGGLARCKTRFGARGPLLGLCTQSVHFLAIAVHRGGVVALGEGRRR
jgi:hypothetical protein